MRSALGRDPQHATVLDAHLLAEQGQVLTKLVVVLFQADAGVEAVGGPAAGESQREVGEGSPSMEASQNETPGSGRGRPRQVLNRLSLQGNSEPIRRERRTIFLTSGPMLVGTISTSG